MPLSPASGVYISQLIRYNRQENFLKQGRLLTEKFMLQGHMYIHSFEAGYWQTHWWCRDRNMQSHLQEAFRNICGCFNDLICQYHLPPGQMRLILFIPIVEPFWTHWYWLRNVPFTSSINMTLSAPAPTCDICRARSIFIPFSGLYFLKDKFTRAVAVRYVCHFIQMLIKRRRKLTLINLMLVWGMQLKVKIIVINNITDIRNTKSKVGRTIVDSWL
jgi:hypothetical protein